MVYSAEQFEQFAPRARRWIKEGMIDQGPDLLAEYGIDTRLRLCHFLAQCAHESDGFNTFEEYASGAAYEGRLDLGNTEPGDGKRYKGRGAIQLTGRYNYRKFTEWCFANVDGAVPNFEDQPEQVRKFPWGLLAAVWYWHDRGLNKLADRNDLNGITKKINGGYNGLSDRQAWYQRAWNVWGGGEEELYATRGKKLTESTTVGAAVGSAATTIGTVAVATKQVKDIGGDVKDVVGWVPPSDVVFWVVAAVAVGLAIWIIRERMKKSKEFKV